MTIRQSLTQDVLKAFISHTLGARIGNVFTDTFIGQGSLDDKETEDLRKIYNELTPINNISLFEDMEDVDFYLTELYNRIFTN